MFISRLSVRRVGDVTTVLPQLHPYLKKLTDAWDSKGQEEIIAMHTTIWK